MDTAQLDPDSSIRRYIAGRKVADPHYSVTAFATECGCARQVIYRVLAGDPEVGKNIFDRIEKATGIPSEQLYGEWKAQRRKATDMASATPAGAEPQAAAAPPQPAPARPQPKITATALRRAQEFERRVKAAD